MLAALNGLPTHLPPFIMYYLFLFIFNFTFSEVAEVIQIFLGSKISMYFLISKYFFNGFLMQGITQILKGSPGVTFLSFKLCAP